MRPRILLALMFLALPVAGCGARPGDEGGDRAVQVVATTTQVADMVRSVSPDTTVTQILQPNSDPHDYEPRPSDARAIEQADVVFRSGGEVDEWMDDLIEAGGGDARVVDLSKSVHLRGDDPHWWQDPHNAARAAGAIAIAISKVTGHRPGGTGAYTRRLDRLDRRVAACIDRLPPARRKLVTSHDALGYYTDRYGLDVVGAVIPSLSTQAQPSSKAVNDLVDQIKRERVAAIFPESSLNPKIEKAVARESGARVGGSLWADALGPKGSDGATYIGSITDNTDTIVRALSGGKEKCP